MKSEVLIIIPARGGSKGIPRKNIRPLNEKPLISYSINTALRSKYSATVYVTSEDDEILSIAELFGAKIHKRDNNLADDKTTLDPVIFSAYEEISNTEGKRFDLIVTLQPTSPLLKLSSLDDALDLMCNDISIDTIISGTNDTHLTWKKVDQGFVPNYEKRVNRQELISVFKETGSFLITRNSVITATSRIGKNVHIYEISGKEAVDIDNFEDWQLCEYYLSKKRIVFVVEGYDEIGMGHVYNSLSIAHQILNHEIFFIVGKKSKLAYEKINSDNYKVFMQESDNILNDIFKLNPDIVVNDRLDNDKTYVKSLKSKGYKVINFEDLGEGAKYADLVINAIYPEKDILPNHYFGHKYFVLRDEFLFSPTKKIQQTVKSVLVSFGGVDPNNYTFKVLEAIYNYCNQRNIVINIVAGKGYKKYDSLKQFSDVNIYKNVNNISRFILDADIVFTSAGRTTFEVASLGTPAIVLAQNNRELTHFFASEEYGFINLGLGTKVNTNEIYERFAMLVESIKSRKVINEKMLNYDLKKSKKRVIKLIEKVIHE